MSAVAYVSLVPRSKRNKLRALLESEDTGALNWVEKKKLFGSEFYFSGPTTLVRKTHDFTKEDSRTIHFPVRVPPKGETTVRYSVRYTW